MQMHCHMVLCNSYAITTCVNMWLHTTSCVISDYLNNKNMLKTDSFVKKRSAWNLVQVSMINVNIMFYFQVFKKVFNIKLLPYLKNRQKFAFRRKRSLNQ